jgi:hypothetical protein
MSKRLDDLTELVQEIDARAYVSEMFAAQLLLRVGLLFDNPRGFVSEVIENVRRDLVAGLSGVGTAEGVQRGTDAVNHLESFHRRLQPILDELPSSAPPSVN